MKPKITSVKLLAENKKKMDAVIKETGMTQTDFINSAIANAVIIGISESKEIAKGFIGLRDAVTNGLLDENGKQEVERICRSLNTLTAEIEAFQNSKIE